MEQLAVVLVLALLRIAPSSSYTQIVVPEVTGQLMRSSELDMQNPNEESNISEGDNQKKFRVRTVTAFVNLHADDFSPESNSKLSETIAQGSFLLETVRKKLEESGYEVQTTRLATNPFGQWLHAESSPNSETEDRRLDMLASALKDNGIQFCSVGPAETLEDIPFCPKIVAACPFFSCSANVPPADVDRASAAAKCILAISKLGGEDPALSGGLGNFRFCAAASCKPFIPFFPAAKSSSLENDKDAVVGFALGLENGALAKSLLQQCKSVRHISSTFRDGMAAAIMPLQRLCEKASKDLNCRYLGIDSSLNPSLDTGGSVAEAIETLDEVRGSFGCQGTLGAAASITTSLQTLPATKLTGYCGLMLPVCEDTRLSELASLDDSTGRLKISDILSISSVCGVGVDTLPVPGSCTESSLASLILDVAGLAGRWDKSLSCRVFPVPGRVEGEMTEFNSPYMCNCHVFPL